MKNWKAWTPAEDELLRAALTNRRTRTSVDWDKLTWATGRTRAAVQARAHRLCLAVPGRDWTPAEDAYLTREWTEMSIRGLREHLPGRSTEAIRQRARTLGLTSRVRRQGMVSVTTAARRAGYTHFAMRRLLERQGVTLRRLGVVLRADPQRHVLHVAWDDVVAAVERDTRLETPLDAARRLGVSDWTVRVRVLAAGIELPAGRKARLPPETYDRALGVAQRMGDAA